MERERTLIIIKPDGAVITYGDALAASGRIANMLAAKGVKPIAWFDSKTPLRSGWSWGQAYLDAGVIAVDESAAMLQAAKRRVRACAPGRVESGIRLPDHADASLALRCPVARSGARGRAEPPADDLATVRSSR